MNLASFAWGGQARGKILQVCRAPTHLHPPCLGSFHLRAELSTQIVAINTYISLVFCILTYFNRLDTARGWRRGHRAFKS